jgi:exopolysaccharide production protein ExoZ
MNDSDITQAKPVERLEFIGVLRGVACLFVVYAHVIVNYAKQHGIQLDLVTWVQDYVTEPLAIIQNFGWFGVVLFFLISGYIITHTLQRDSIGSFAIKRILRIYPAFIVCVGITAIGRYYMYDKPFFAWDEYLLSFTLSGIWPTKQYIQLGVEWTLVIEMKFYLLTFLTFYFLKRKPAVAVILQMSVIALALYYCRSFGNTFFLFTVSISYVPFLITGQLLYLLQTKKVGPLFFVFGTLAAVSLAIYGIKSYHPRYLQPDNAYMVTFVYCYAVFCLSAIFSQHIRSNQISRFFENISYSLYLYHGLICFSILDLVAPYIDNHWIRIIIALAGGFLVSWWSFIYVEKTAQNAGRALITYFKNRKSATGKPTTSNL